MPDTRLILVPIPHGVGPRGDLAVSIVMSPRLSGEDRLGAFADMLTWTARLAAGARVSLRFGVTVVDGVVDTEALKPGIWSALFSAGTPVDPFEFDDYTDRVVVSYPTRDVADTIERRYAELSTRHPDAPPSALDTARVLDEFSLPNVAPHELERLLASHRLQRRDRQDAPAGRRQSFSETARDFALYHRMPQPSAGAPSQLPSRAQLAATLDFHKAVAALCNYPALQRALGLVIEVLVRADAVPPSGELGFPLGTVAVEAFAVPGGWEGAVQVATPQVWYRHRPAQQDAAARFFAVDAPGAPSDTVEGFLALDAARFHLLDLDVDGAMARLTSLAGMLPRAPAWVDGALPALRSAGLAVAVNQRGAEVVRALRRAAQINAGLAGGPSAPLGASDLVRGYRLDVWSSDNGRWHSLHAREETYLFGDDGAVKVEATDEGFAQLTTASPVPDPTRAHMGGPPVETDLYVHERLARWTGWSLSAPRPGRPLNRSADSHRATEPDPTADELVTAFKMRTHFKPVPRSLPRLRFGTSYRVRARTVDLAGNSPSLTPFETGPQSAPAFPVSLPAAPVSAPYLRYEPVPPPLVVLRSVPEDREPSLLRIVIRSFNLSVELDSIPTEETDERHIAPPRTSAEMAERHGMLDYEGAVRGDAATFAMLVARHDAKLPTTSIGDPPTDVPIVTDARLRVDYLPDPVARGAALRFLPGVPPGRVSRAGAGIAHTDDPSSAAGPVLQVHFGDAWPNRQAFRLELVEGSGPPEWNALDRALRVSLPKAAAAKVALSSSIGERDLAVLGVWAWQRRYLEDLAQHAISAAGDGLAAELEEQTRLAERLARLALEGGQWALTPSVAVTLVHAVQQPLARPAFASLRAAARDGHARFERSQLSRLHDGRAPLAASRQRASPDLFLVGALELHYPGTARVDILAHCIEVVDEGDVGRRLVEHSGAVEPLQLPEPPPAEIAAQSVDARAVAVVDEAGGRLEFLPERWVAGELRAAAAPVHRIGHTRHAVVTYRAVATSRFEDDFPRGAGLDFTRAGDPVTIDVPSSAAPLAPRIADMLPTFGWRRQSAGTVATSIRAGQSVRIFLERPWYSSGDGELLGVVVWPAGLSGPSDADRRDRYQSVVTQWGVDPVRQSGSLAAMPTLADFPDARTTSTGVRLPGVPGIAFDIAGHTVAFDTDRKLWYADVTVAADTAYMPFVRLALVRFQPHSIPDVEASPVAVADFTQLTPDRSAVLIRDPDAPTLYRLIVSGFAARPSAIAPWRSEILVTVQARQPGVDSDLGWRDVQASTATVTSAAAPPNAPAVLYSGYIELAAAARAGELRVLIREFEMWSAVPPERMADPRAVAPPSDPGELRLVDAPRTAQVRAAQESAAGGAEAPLAGGGLTAHAIERLNERLLGPRTAQRLVYADTIALEPLASAADETERASYPLPPEQEIEPEPEAQLPSYAGPPPPRLPEWNMPSIAAGNVLTVRPEVKLAQAMLNAVGAAVPALAIDGRFGTQTAAAVTLFRERSLLPPGAMLDPPTWLALALAAPFPQLERGIGNPPTAGPPVSLVQRLLNARAGEIVAAETGSYDADTEAAVEAFQADRALPQTGIIDVATWLQLSELIGIRDATGAEHVLLDFDLDRAAAGGEAVEILERVAVSNQPTPTSDPVEEDWTGRAGCWIEIRDGFGALLFRRLVVLEQPPAGEVVRRSTIQVTLPVSAAARSLAIFGNLDDYFGAARLLRAVEPW